MTESVRPNLLVAAALCSVSILLALSTCALRPDDPYVVFELWKLSQNAVAIDDPEIHSSVEELQRSVAESFKSILIHRLLVGLAASVLAGLCFRRELCPRTLAWLTVVVLVLVMAVFPLFIVE